MKRLTIKSIFIIANFVFFQNRIAAQVINWGNQNYQGRHLLNATLGTDYGITAGLGYHYRISLRKFPVWIGSELSIPAGNELADDYKFKLGAQIRIATIHHFLLSARIQAISRRYHNQSVRLFNFGSDFAGTIGYYQKRWFMGVETGFDKAIVTNFKHSEWYRKNIYNEVQDGWYEPATGGNFYYGLQGGLSIKKVDFSIKVEKVLQQDFKSKPLLPLIGQFGVNFKF
ncbi:hypothetical protein I5M32_09255 [Pedobacter sp. SD-b]|uniref:Outer membrane protein beta-barrel domain-containing protein n=1 Tax=Pedobacter segetis TaxID=2793069 RepID=A0ABS1BJS4_9SPHI|nr:hypothetical protein [Pedobacter segetis]MBK0383144.1 hypothetical protein [Pedobacter segetis]